MFVIKNVLKQGDDLSPLIFNVSLDYAIKRVQANQIGLKLNGTDRLPVMLMILIYWDEAYAL